MSRPADRVTFGEYDSLGGRLFLERIKKRESPDAGHSFGFRLIGTQIGRTHSGSCHPPTDHDDLQDRADARIWDRGN
jgi:hypothetical protein